jgi:hypothetical protein
VLSVPFIDNIPEKKSFVSVVSSQNRDIDEKNIKTPYIATDNTDKTDSGSISHRVDYFTHSRKILTNDNTDQIDKGAFFSQGISLLHQSVQALEFFNRMYISQATLSRLWIGLNPAKGHETEVIFPCSATSWYSGVIGDNQTLDNIQFHGQGMCVFGMNLAYREPKRTVFVTRTLVDCLSVMETGNLAVFADEDHIGDLIECLNNNPQIPTHEAYRHCMTVLMVDTDPKSMASQQNLGHKLRHVFVSSIPVQYGSLSNFLVEDRKKFETFLNANKTEHRN